MDASLQYWINQLFAYPEWVVVSLIAIAGGIALWLLAKIFTWLIKWLLIGMTLAAVVGMIVFFSAA